MRAAVGDRLHFEGKVVGMHEHTAVEARAKDGGPPSSRLACRCSPTYAPIGETP
jgi:hypothetical protein